ncbi:hypothetical protein F5Y04DRAFT_283196 [Hypomontagnella monticulosa]|nr:hypothetical protein F5Y04DRAFT_283196 [Hypomontagnella monticulosa]
MIYSKPLLALASVFTLASSRSHARTAEELEPWQVSRMTTFSPSGRPGSSKFANTYAIITNPGSNPANGDTMFGPSRANCTAEWTWLEDEPYGQIFPCDTAQNETSTTVAKWTMEIIEVANSTQFSPTENFDVKFTLTQTIKEDSESRGEATSKTYEGTEHFELGVNMRGSCGGSGVCSWSLDQEKIPILIHQKLLGS